MVPADLINKIKGRTIKDISNDESNPNFVKVIFTLDNGNRITSPATSTTFIEDVKTTLYVDPHVENGSLTTTPVRDILTEGEKEI